MQFQLQNFVILCANSYDRRSLFVSLYSILVEHRLYTRYLKQLLTIYKILKTTFFSFLYLSFFIWSGGIGCVVVKGDAIWVLGTVFVGNVMWVEAILVLFHSMKQIDFRNKKQSAKQNPGEKGSDDWKWQQHVKKNKFYSLLQTFWHNKVIIYCFQSFPRL